MFKNEISIHRLCPQSVLKHSLVHSQGIGMKIYFFFKIFFVKRCSKMKFLSIDYVLNQF